MLAMDKPTPTRLVIEPTLVSIPTFEILSKHPTLDCLNTQFQMFVEVFGLYVVAPSSAPEEYVTHSANVLAQYIDNDAGGLPDDSAVLEHLQHENVLVPVWEMSTREQFNQARRRTECEDGVTLVASMYYDEDQWAIGGIESTGKWDTNLEEIENKAEKIILENQGEKVQKDREPVAFGINAVILSFARDENLDNDEMLDTIRAIKNITSAEIIDFRRAFG